MNKIFRIISNTLFFINTIILFSSYTHIFNFSFVKITTCSIIVLILLIINIVQIKQKNKIIFDKKYNTLFLLVNIIVLVIFLREKFDQSIPLGSANNVIIFDYNTSGLFIDYNAIYITIMYAGLLLYNLLNKEKKHK
ncbi:MAG TPA: hypothetical protein GXZ95_02180 [Mollicutes bacterium]|nr:hypothetical protein [Mollicutes bacterium]